MSDPQPTLPLSLSKHVTQAIAGRIHISTMIRHEIDDDGDVHHVLRPGGEWAIWEVVQAAISEAGWRLTHD